MFGGLLSMWFRYIGLLKGPDLYARGQHITAVRAICMGEFIKNKFVYTGEVTHLRVFQNIFCKLLVIKNIQHNKKYKNKKNKNITLFWQKSGRL